MATQLVIIVDDRLTNLMILARLVGSLENGARANSFSDADTALQACITGQPDLVIVDVGTAELDGLDFVRRLRASPAGAEVPIVAIVDAEDREQRHRAFEAGASDYVSSPVEHREFRARVGTLLRLRRYRHAEAGGSPGGEQRAPDEELRLQEALQQAHERLLRVIDAVPMMIAATDREGRYIFVNNRFAGFLGVRARRLIGQAPTAAQDEPFSQRLRARDSLLLAGDNIPATFEEEAVDHLGERRVLLTTKSVFHGEDGERSMVVTVSLDITTRRAAELDLIAAKEQAEIANRSKTEFLANMSHELRTPLNAIIGFSQVMAGEMLGPIATEKYVGYARDIVGSAEHLLGIINDILDVSKLEAGKLELIETSIDLPAMAADLLHLFEAKARAGDIRITLRADRDLPRLRGDIRKLKQVILNLVVNAVKFSRRGSEVEIVLRNNEGAVVILVVDHGIGMDARELDLAVSRFGQVASTWARNHAGTGLGLPLAIGLTEMHGGTLSIASEKGIGSTVTLSFPRERSVPTGQATGEASRPADSAARAEMPPCGEAGLGP